MSADQQRILARAVREVESGQIVNLGIGLLTRLFYSPDYFTIYPRKCK
ncbi:hypothetical protein LG290_08925 [Halomonas sediminis]